MPYELIYRSTETNQISWDRTEWGMQDLHNNEAKTTS